MTLRELMISIGYDVDPGGEKKVENSISRIKSMAGKILGAIGISFNIMGLKGVVEAAADLKAVNSQFDQTFKDIDTGRSYFNEATLALQTLAEETGIAEERMKGSYASITAFAKTSGMDIEEAMQFSAEAMELAADSAAYFDRSMEDTTYILKSLLKGNFQMDDNLGFQATQYTRDAKALELFGKKYNDLTEAMKQKTILGLMRDANKQMGAMRQAKRESEEWTNQIGNLTSKTKSLAAAIGDGFLDIAIKGIHLASKGLDLLIRLVGSLTAKNGFLAGITRSIFSIAKKLEPALHRVYEVFSRFTSKGADGADKVNRRLKLVNSVLRIIAVAVAALLAKFAFSAALSSVKLMISAFKLLGITISGIGAALWWMAVIAGIILLVEDFVYFLNGDASLIGVFFDKLGIGAQTAREGFFDAFTKIGEIVGSVFGFLANIFSGTGGLLYALGKSIYLLGKVFWGIFGNQITQSLKDFVSIAGTVIMGVLSLLEGLIRFVTSILVGDWEGAFTAMKDIATSIVDTIFSVVTQIWGHFDRLISDAKNWGIDLVTNIIDGIRNSIPSLDECVDGVANTIRAKLHFTVPDEGPLKDFETWMPDMMKGMADTLANSSGVLLNQVNLVAQGIKDGILGENDGVLDGMRSLSKAASVRPSTASSTAVSNRNTSFVQNINFDNTYSGGTREVQRSISDTMNKSANDITAVLARGLAYAR